MLGDQIRDWSIALRPLVELPLVGPPTHFGGYTIGPAFYWILWTIRATIGPWFENLPHAGGIGQAILQSGVDTVLLVAIWRRTQSVWIALTTIVLLATASFDLNLSAVIWNPVVGSILAKLAIALVLLDWHRRSAAAVAVTAAVAWCAVHAYTGAIFVTLGVFAALVIDPFARGDRQKDRAEALCHRSRWRRPGHWWPSLGPWHWWASPGHWWHSPSGLSARNMLIMTMVVALLQAPYAAHQLSNRFGDRAMGVVTGSLGQVLSGSQRPQFGRSLAAYATAFHDIQVSPFQAPWTVWLLLGCAAIFAVAHRRDPTLVTVTLAPQGAALIGYALFLGDLDNYYYLSLMPGAVLVIVLAMTSLLGRRLVRVVAIVLFIVALAIVPARLSYAALLPKMTEYGALVDGSRKMAKRAQPLRAIETEFKLPFTADTEFIYTILGGRLDPESPWVGIIKRDGTVSYQNVSPRP